MRSVKYLLIPTLLISIWSAALAQDKGEISITTRPSGATVYLSGEFDLVANTPARLPMDVSGRYKAKITRPGYETWKGELTFIPGSTNEIEIKLKMKTRFKAALRSLFVPGWGQRYYGSPTRGSIITSAAMISAASIIIMDREYSNKKREYNIAYSDFTAASSIEEKNALKIILDEKQKHAYDAETNRNTAIAIGITVWAFNFIDALIFFPETDVFYPTVTSLGDGASITLSARF